MIKLTLNKWYPKAFFILIILLINGPATFAQLGYSSASLSMGKMNSRSGLIPMPEQVTVEEYFNYHRHELELPENGQSIAMDISSYHAPDKSIILQVGLCTDTVSNLEEIPPVNVCLVIDRSGSMSGDRIEKAKEAAVEFVNRLREKDVLSVVLFDDQIDVLISAQKVKNKNKLINTIRTIEVRGSTDLNGGIIRGYTEVSKHYNKEQNNKVIVLTDALTNTGVVDPMQIVQNSTYYKKEQEIDITMVGVGIDFNNGLARQITTENRSSIFFVNDAEDIKKVFIDEIESLLSPVAKEVSLAIRIPDEMKIEKCFGYTAQIHDNTLDFDLENMNNGLTQVFLIKLRPKDPGTSKLKKAVVGAELNYYDIALKEKAVLSASNNILKDNFENERDIEKNYCIARMAECIKDIAILCQDENYSEAKYRANYILESTLTFYPDLSDPDVKRVYDILKKYEDTLKKIEPNDAATLSFPY